MQLDQELTKFESRYQFHSLIGKGGAGEVFAAWDDHLKRTVAIKRIKPNGLDDATLANPWTEAISLAAIRHANIVTIYDMGQENDTPYIVMEHVQGETIDERVNANGIFPVPEFADMARQTLEGLVAAHHAGLIHRDLKPSNVMLSPLPTVSFRVKILDFGMAKFLSTPSAQTINLDGSITGSIAWISPEQLNRQAVDARSDLYSIGCVFYYALSGKEPFTADSIMDVMTAHFSHDVVPLGILRPDLPAMLSQWVMTLFNLRPEDRYQSAMQALADLNSIMTYTQQLIPAAGPTTTIITPAAPTPQVIPISHGNNGTLVNANSVVQHPSKERAPARSFWKITTCFLILLLLAALGCLTALVQSSQPSQLHSETDIISAATIKAPDPALPTVSAALPAPVATPAPTPVPAATPAPLVPAEVILRIHGSNTIGAKLLPVLLTEFLKAEGATDIQRRVGKTTEDLSLEAVINGTKQAILIEAHGTTTGFDGLLAGRCDLGMASRPVKPEEIASFAAASLGDLRSAAFEHVLGLDGIAILVNKDNPVASLTKQDIAKIFSGQFTDWQQVGGTPGPIHLYARDGKSGTFDTFKSLVLDRLELHSAATRFEDSNELSDSVAADPAGIGFVGLPFIREAKALAVSEAGTSPFIASRFTVATEDYLLSRRLFLYTTSISRNKPLIKKFLEFTMSDDGQTVVHNLGFVKQTLDLQRMAAPSGAPLEYVEAIREADRLSLNLRFRPSSTQLDNKALRDMDRILNILSQTRFQGKSLLLLGFADGVGSHVANQKLSKERAELVSKEFAMRGFNATQVLGLGSVLPVASNDTESGRDKNRRVEVWVK